LPLFIVTGPSGSGKTAVIPALRSRLPDADVFETDQIWDSGGDWQMVKCNWLRVALAVAQSGRISILCGTILPHEVNACEHAALFRSIHYLALMCSDEARAERLKQRKGTLACSSEFIEEHHRLSRWFIEHSQTAFHPPLQVVDTTYGSPDDTAEAVAHWVSSALESMAFDAAVSSPGES
jgi:hypothetical protein